MTVSMGNVLTVSTGGIYHILVGDDGSTSGKVDLITLYEAAHYETNGQRSRYMGRLMEQIPCVVEMDVKGKIIGFKTAEYVSAADRDVLRGMNGVQVVLGLPDSKGGWLAEEEDATGVAKVRYSVSAEGRIAKQRVEYLRLNAQGMLPNSKLAIEASAFTAQLGTVWLKSLHGAETMVFSYQGKPAWQSRVELTLEQRQAALPALLGQLPRQVTGLTALKLFEGDRPEIIRLAGAGSVSDLDAALVRASAYAAISFDDIMGSTESVMASAQNHSERMPAIESLRDWLLARPEEATKMIDYLKKPDMESVMSAGILHALELASASQTSQAVLAAILSPEGQAAYTQEVLLQAAVAAGGVGDILDQSLMNNLYALAFNPGQEKTAEASDSALLSLGILAKGNAEIRARMASDLLDTLDETTPSTEGYVATALMALGNGGVHNEALDTKALALFQSGASDTIRAEALAFLSAKTGDSALAISALRNPSAAIQTRAVEVLTGLDALSLNAAAELSALVADPARSEALRTIAAQQLKRHEGTYPSITDAYRKALSQEPSEDMTRVLTDLLRPATVSAK